MGRSSTEATIFGHKFTLTGSVDPQAMRDLAAGLDTRMRELARPKPGEPIHRVAIYTALVLLDELRKAQAALEEERRRFDAASRATAELDLRLHALINEPRPRDGEGAALGLEEHPEELELEGMAPPADDPKPETGDPQP